MLQKINVKTGDKVLVVSKWDKSIREVKRVTPTGNIRLEDGSYFNKYGSEKTSDTWNTRRITLLTEELEKEINEMKYVRDILKLLKKVESLTIEQAIKIREILIE